MLFLSLYSYNVVYIYRHVYWLLVFWINSLRRLERLFSWILVLHINTVVYYYYYFKINNVNEYNYALHIFNLVFYKRKKNPQKSSPYPSSLPYTLKTLASYYFSFTPMCVWHWTLSAFSIMQLLHPLKLLLCYLWLLTYFSQ